MKASEPIRRMLIFGIEIAVSIIVGIIAADAFAAQATLAWDPNTDSNLAGYKIHYGIASGSYTAHLDVHNVTTYTVTGLTDDQTYYFAATSYTATGNESEYSNEVSYSASAGQIASFTLVNAATDQDIKTLANGDVINLAVTGTSLSIRANVSGSVGSVRFALDGNTNFRTESAVPYALAGDSNGNNYEVWTPALGSHSLTATPYSASGGTGTAGSPLSIGFTVTNAATASQAPAITAGPQAATNPVTLPATTTVSVTASDPSGDPLTYAWSKTSGPGTVSFTNAAAASTAVAFSAAGSYTLRVSVSDGTATVTRSVNVSVLSNSASAGQIASFTLVNAATDQDIKTLANGDVINLAVTGTSLSIRANVSGSVGSVRFALDGNTNFRTESAVPYALAGDSNGNNYEVWTPALGSHSLTATPYSASGGTGTAGSPLSIGFTVTNAASASQAPAITAGPQAATNPVTLPATTTVSNSVSNSGQAADTVSTGSNGVATTGYDNRGLTATVDDAATHCSIAVFRPSTGEWFLDLNANCKLDGGGADGKYKFGKTGDLPVTGVWNKDGVIKIGVFRPSTGEWFLDFNGNDSLDDKGVDGYYKFGTNGDLPVTGDWNNDGVTEIGVFRPSTGEWLLDLNGNRKWDGGAIDGLYKFGTNGDLPVTGDWNNDGVTEIGVFRPSTGEWLLDLNGNDKWDGGTIDGFYKFGTNGDLPVTGNWI